MLLNKLYDKMSGQVQVNKINLIFLGIGGCMLVYFLYSAIPKKVFRSYHEHHTGTWKVGKFRSIPQEVIDMQGNVNVEEKTAKFKVGDEQVSIFYHEAFPLSIRVSRAPVIFLHGAGDSSANWLDIGSLHLVASIGHRTIALDLPGWGKSETRSVSDPGKFLEEFLVHVGVQRPILVPVSMGGSYALPYLMRLGPAECHRQARGFVPIAIVGTSRYTPAMYHKCHVPTMIVYGVKDTGLGLNSVGDLRNLADSEIFPIEKAGHACHHEKTDEFHAILYNFLKMTYNYII